jgi:hypothetical protein
MRVFLSSPFAEPRPAARPLLIDHTRWVACVVEIVAIAGAVVFAYLHSA